ncbi:MAG: trypsin-like peptidase domain-containing protein, partial [Myxococcota bacterium]
VERPAKLLAYDSKLRLAVARGPIQSKVVPLLPDLDRRLRKDQWVVTIRHGKKGKAIPHAGTVNRKRTKWGRVAELRAQLGAPILDLKGRLVGVVRGGTRRRANILPIRRIMPFLRSAVLGSD